MNASLLFFSPQGRIGPRTFGRGFIILTGIMTILITLAGVVAPDLGILQSALVFPYLCVFGKRLHDAGLSAFLWVGLLLAYILIAALASAVLMPLLSPEAYKLNLEFQEVFASGGTQAAFDLMRDRAGELERLSVMTTLAGFLIASAIIGLGIGRLRSEPGSNKYGPKPMDGAGL